MLWLARRFGVGEAPHGCGWRTKSYAGAGCGLYAVQSGRREAVVSFPVDLHSGNETALRLCGWQTVEVKKSGFSLRRSQKRARGYVEI